MSSQVLPQQRGEHLSQPLNPIAALDVQAGHGDGA